MTAIKAILVQPLAGTIRPVILNDENRLAEIRSLIGCDMIDMVGIDTEHSIVLDDNGLHESLPCVTHLKGYGSPLAGNLLIVGTNADGDTVDVTRSLDEIAGLLDIVRPVFRPVFETLDGHTVFGTRLVGMEVHVERRPPVIATVQ